MIKASAPGRAGVIGNPTDLYGGSVVSCSIGERAYCEMVPSDTLVIRAGDEELTVSNPRDLDPNHDNFDIAKASLRALEIDIDSAKFRIDLHTDVPEQAGLAGSTALMTATVGALTAWLDLELSKYELAETVHKIEAEVMCLTCGYQDHYMAVFGGLSFLDFRGKEWMRQSCDEPFACVEPLSEYISDLPLVLAHTGVKRNSGSVHKSLRERWVDGEQEVVDAYRRIGELGRLGKKALLEGDWKALGELMNENHVIQRDLGGSGESNEKLISAALANGAYGAKLAGAGHGGTIIALSPGPEDTAKALLDAGAQRILRVKPSDGLVVEREW